MEKYEEEMSQSYDDEDMMLDLDMNNGTPPSPLVIINQTNVETTNISGEESSVSSSPGTPSSALDVLYLDYEDGACEKGTWNCHVRGHLNRIVPHRNQILQESEMECEEVHCTALLDTIPLKGLDKSVFHLSMVRKIFTTDQCTILLLNNDRFCLVGEVDERFGYVGQKTSQTQSSTATPVTPTTSTTSTMSDIQSNDKRNRKISLFKGSIKNRTRFNPKNNQSGSTLVSGSTFLSLAASSFQPAGKDSGSIQSLIRPRFGTKAASTIIYSNFFIDNEKKYSCVLAKFNAIWDPVQEIIVSKRHSFILTENGKVYGLVSNCSFRKSLL